MLAYEQTSKHAHEIVKMTWKLLWMQMTAQIVVDVEITFYHHTIHTQREPERKIKLLSIPTWTQFTWSSLEFQWFVYFCQFCCCCCFALHCVCVSFLILFFFVIAILYCSKFKKRKSTFICVYTSYLFAICPSAI